MMGSLLPILIPTTAVPLLALTIALCRSAARADAVARRLESADPTETSNFSSASVRRQAPQPSTNERLPSTAARAGTREPARPALPGRAGGSCARRPHLALVQPAREEARRV